MKNRMLWTAMGVLSIITLAMTAAVLRLVVFPPPQVVFERMTVETPVVQAGGILQVQLIAKYRNLDCFSGAARIIHFNDGTEFRALGTRYAFTEEQPQRQFVTHTVTLPTNAPPGRATIQIRDNFTCGMSPVNSPTMPFEIVAR